MKNWVLILFVIFIQKDFGQVPNYSFENWTNSSPDAWQTTNIPIVPPSIIPDSDAVDGMLSVRGIVVPTANNLPHPPYLGISGPLSLGFPIAQAFDVLSGWCKLSLLPGDKFFCNIRIYDSQQFTIGDGSISLDTDSSGWNPFFVNVNYFDTTIAVNCSMYFTITDSTGLMSGQIGSYFLLDNLSLSSIAGIEDVSPAENFSVYPNPAHSDLHLIADAGHQNLSYSLNNIAGNVVMNGRLNGSGEIFIENLSPGIYFLNLLYDDKRSVKKVLIE